MAALLTFVVLLLIQVPIAFVLGITSIAYITSTGDFGLLPSVPQRLYSGMESFSMIAIPLFMLAGELMNFGGITTRLVTFAQRLFGHFRAGLAYVNIAANMLLASLLGSLIAQTAVMSRVMVPAMEKEGYRRDFSAATTAAAAIFGPIIPPSVIFILYSVNVGVSVGDMFLAGIIPGLLLGVGFILLVAYLGYRLDLPKSERGTLKEIITSFVKVAPALSIPVIIVGGIISGAFTPTESASIACAIALIVGIVLYRELSIKDIPKIFINTAITTGMVTLMIAMAQLFGLVLTYEQVPQGIADWMVSLTENPLVFLLLLNIFLLLVGMVMDGLAAIVILAPIIAPIALLYDIDPIHLGVVMSLNLIIGALTPPVGTGLFIASSLGEVKLENLIKAVWPFVAVAILVLFLLTYFPQLVLWIPENF